MNLHKLHKGAVYIKEYTFGLPAQKFEGDAGELKTALGSRLRAAA